MASFDVETINPKLNPAYSPDLYAFLGKSCFRSKQVSFYRVRGNPWVGTEDSAGRFIGGRVDDIVIFGSGVSTVSWPLRPGEDRDDALWAEYLRIGVCALFAEHKDGNYPQRWATDGDKRTCQWCGRVERLRRWEEFVTREAWEVVTVPSVDLWPNPDHSGEPSEDEVDRG